MRTNSSRNLYIETQLLSLVRRKEQTIGREKAEVARGGELDFCKRHALFLSSRTDTPLLLRMRNS